MSKTFEVLGVIAFILGAIFVTMTLDYALTGLVQSGAGPGFLGSILSGLAAASLVNIVILLLVFVMIIATLLTLAERKWSAMMQDRLGPNRARIALPGLKNRALGGLPHVAADSLKMLFKEDFRPASANKVLFFLGPVLAFAPVFALFAVIPAGPSITFQGHSVHMYVSSPNFGILYLFAIASLAVYGTALAGWSSNNKFALLGGVRASSQMISYEVALGLSLVGAMICFGTVQLPAMIEAQSKFVWGGSTFGLPAWGIFVQPLGFLFFFAAAFAETKRAPFDVPEGESEIIGYFVEYSGMKFGMFMISEFVEVVVLSAVCTAVFFGGHHLPFVREDAFRETLARPQFFQDHPATFSALWGGFLGTVFWVKVILLCWVQLAIRWTFPRFRYNQIQTLGWKMLLPAGLLNLFVTGALLLADPSLQMLTGVGLFQIAFILLLANTKRQPATPALETPAHGAHAAHGH